MCIEQLSAIQTDINKGRGSANNLIAERVALFGLARPPDERQQFVASSAAVTGAMYSLSR